VALGALSAPRRAARRSFDQFANLVLEAAVERVIVGALYAETPLGLYVVRGENVVLLGEIDEARDPPPALQRVRAAAAPTAQLPRCLRGGARASARRCVLRHSTSCARGDAAALLACLCLAVCAACIPACSA